ncbi:hypothetical protein BG000_010107, partial [Podila horticola]
VLSILTVLAAAALVHAAPVPPSSSSQMIKRNDSNNLALRKRVEVDAGANAEVQGTVDASVTAGVTTSAQKREIGVGANVQVTVGSGATTAGADESA